MVIASSCRLVGDSYWAPAQYERRKRSGAQKRQKQSLMCVRKPDMTKRLRLTRRGNGVGADQDHLLSMRVAGRVTSE